MKKLYKSIEEKDIDSLLKHGNIGNKSNSANELEIQYIVEFKKQYPEISISQFQDIYHERIVWNKEKQNDVIKYGLKIRSYSFFPSLPKLSLNLWNKNVSTIL